MRRMRNRYTTHCLSPLRNLHAYPRRQRAELPRGESAMPVDQDGYRNGREEDVAELKTGSKRVSECSHT